jgi:hypothetical protein
MKIGPIQIRIGWRYLTDREKGGIPVDYKTRWKGYCFMLQLGEYSWGYIGTVKAAQKEVCK